MSDENDLSVLANAVSTVISKSRRRSCIQKDSDKRSYENDEETRTTRKSRRVSFSSRIQVKTIDDSIHDPNCSKDKQTKENTKANKHLADISNTSLKTEVNVSVSNAEVSIIDSKKALEDPCNETFFPTRNYLDISNLNQTTLEKSQQNISMDLVNNSNSFINISTNQTVMDNSDLELSNDVSRNMTIDMPFNDVTIAPDKMTDLTLVSDASDSNLEAVEAFSKKTEATNFTCNAEITISKKPQTPEIQIMETTISLAETINQVESNNQTYSAELGENPRRLCSDKSIIKIDTPVVFDTSANEMTLPTQETECNLTNSSIVNISHAANEMTLPLTQEGETTMGYDITNHSIANITAANITTNTSKLLQSVLQITDNDMSKSSLDVTAGECIKGRMCELMQSNFEDGRDLLIQKIDELNRFKHAFEKYEKEKEIHRENTNKEIEMSSELIKGLKAKKAELKDKVSKLKVDNCLVLFEAIELKDNKEIDELVKQNDALEQSLKGKYQNLADIRQQIKSGIDRIESLESSQVEKEKYIEICEKVFDDRVIDFKLVNLEKDTILVSFFYDFIQLEIKATNIVNDLNSFQEKTWDLESLNNDLQKCTKYPIQKLTTRSLVDSVGNSIDSPFYMSEQDRNLLKKQNSKRVPVYIRYCVNLILEDIGDGDLMCINKRYKYIKDIPLLMSHFSLACKCANNLAKDFELFASKSMNTEIKCDFDFSNHMVTITLPSLEDYCWYKLKLNIIPGLYYQEAIPFSIEPVDPDDVFQPNIKRLSKVIEGQYFEDGSLKKFLHKLKLI